MFLRDGDTVRLMDPYDVYGKPVIEKPVGRGMSIVREATKQGWTAGGG